jgi:hypothetical protein
MRNATVLSLTTCLFVTMGFQEARAQRQHPNAMISGVKITQVVINGRGDEIRANTQGDNYGGGYMIGRPVKASLRGLFFKTYEFQVNQGGFEDTNLFIGSVVNCSTDDRAIFRKFQTLDAEKMYVFEYKHINPLNPEIEDSHYQVIAIYTPEEFLSRRNVAAIPVEIRSGDTQEGSLSDGVRQGRIVDVERYGFFANFCSFELNIGGLQKNADGSGEALIELTVLDEEVCKYLEDAIALGGDVEVTYVQDFIEVWQPSSHFCKSVRYVQNAADSEEETDPSTAGPKIERLTPRELEQLKNELIQDSSFVDSLVKAMQRAKSRK